MDYYRTIQKLVTDHNYSVADIEQMYPYERDVIMDLVIQEQEEKQ